MGRLNSRYMRAAAAPTALAALTAPNSGHTLAATPMIKVSAPLASWCDLKCAETLIMASGWGLPQQRVPAPVG